MNKWRKIALYIILWLAIIAVIRLMIGNTNPNVEILETDETLIEEDIAEDTPPTYEQKDTFEEDVMKDLEGFFGTNNGYENIEWEYWFNNPED